MARLLTLLAVALLAWAGYGFVTSRVEPAQESAPGQTRHTKLTVAPQDKLLRALDRARRAQQSRPAIAQVPARTKISAVREEAAHAGLAEPAASKPDAKPSNIEALHRPLARSAPGAAHEEPRGEPSASDDHRAVRSAPRRLAADRPARSRQGTRTVRVTIYRGGRVVSRTERRYVLDNAPGTPRTHRYSFSCPGGVCDVSPRLFRPGGLIDLSEAGER